MERKEEILELLKTLLGKTEDACEDKQYYEIEDEDDFEVIRQAASKVVNLSKKIEKYLEEYKEL